MEHPRPQSEESPDHIATPEATGRTLKARIRTLVAATGVLIATSDCVPERPLEKPRLNRAHWAAAMKIPEERIESASALFARVYEGNWQGSEHLVELKRLGAGPVGFALITKESHLDPDAVSKSKAFGLGQVRDVARVEVNRIFGTAYTPEDLYDPKRAAAGKDAIDDEKNLQMELLYLEHMVREAKRLFPKEDNPTDLLKLALFAYNAGPGNLKKLDTGDDTYVALARHASREFGARTGSPHRKPRLTHDRTTGISYWEIPGVDRYLANGGKLPGTWRGANATKVAQALRYMEIVNAMKEHQQPPTEYDVLREGHMLWSVANDLMREATQVGIVGYTEAELVEYMTRSLRREELLEVLVRYNADISAEFAKIEVDAEYSNVPVGTRIAIPSMLVLNTYIHAIRREAKEGIRSAEKATEAPPGSIYADPSIDAKGLSRVPAMPEPAIIKRLSKTAGLRARKETNFLMIHATADEFNVKAENIVEGIRRARTSHFFVATDGTLYEIVPRHLAIDHAGDASNRRLGALWIAPAKDGSGRLVSHPHISYESIAIEVQCPLGRDWTDAQYAAVKQLAHFLSAEHGLRYCDTLGHRMVASTPIYKTRGRKGDPYVLNWDRLGYPNNDLLRDYAVERKILQSNLPAIEATYKPRGPQSEKRNDTYDGLRFSDQVAKTGKGKVFGEVARKTRPKEEKGFLEGLREYFRRRGR